MVFNSFPFVVFFIIVFLVYWYPLKEKTNLQNFFLLVASWFFYGYANWKILPLLIVSILIFYFLGKAISKHKTDKTGSWLTTLGVVLGIGALVYFKYFNFFIDSFAALFNSLGLQTNLHTFNIILPLGISFYTFRLLSYIIDIHRGKGEATNDFVAFATYISFFPCLLSGPIDRPKFIAQLQKTRTFSYAFAVDGSRQILWGLFKKMVIADNIATYVDAVWGNMDARGGSTFVLAAILYLFQIYADFSGYSDMAIGVGKLLGFKIADNFKAPLFALNIADYWRRWHITLTQWLTDYVFMPLNIKFRDLGNGGIILAILINFVLIGMWHGADWTFALFGLYHGLLYIPLILSGAFFKKTKLQTNKLGLPVLKDFGRIILTMFLVVVGLILFRADNMGQAINYTQHIFQTSLFSMPWLYASNWYPTVFISIILLIVLEWLTRKEEHPLTLFAGKPIALQVVVYYALVIAIYFLHPQAEMTFIYFQF